MNVAIHYTIAEIAAITKGNWISKSLQNPDPDFLSLDSRKIILPEKTIFFAISTSHQHAAFFIEDLYKKGVKNFVCDDSNFNIDLVPGANIILVNNTVDALQKLAIHHRKKFKYKLEVIGITGSNGKTVVKEWLNFLLEKEYQIVRSPKSFNSQIGVPLSVLNINETHQLGIFEAGISLPSEMKKLQKIIQPQIGILTNIGNAHDQGFQNRANKIQEKLELFTHAEFLVFPSDEKEILKEVIFLKEKNKSLELFSWGKADAVVKIRSIKKENSTTTIEVIHRKKKIAIVIPFTDDASIENAITCCCVLFILKKQTPEILERFKLLYPIAMRLELKQGVNRSTIIDDAYSNDLNSLTIALDFLKQQKQHKIHTVILSDILQSGRSSKELYGAVASLLQQNNIDNFYGIGTAISSYKQEFASFKIKNFYTSTDEFLKAISIDEFHDETILIKGARSFQFEKISHALELKLHETKLTINLSALAFNLKKYKEKLRPSTKIMAMVKAFSYGSGSHEIASVLEFHKADYLAVAYADEGVELRKAGITMPVMVMNVDNATFDSLLNYQLEPEIFSISLFKDFIEFIKSSKKVSVPVHLKIDTGMHRLGFMENEIEELCKLLLFNNTVKVKSVFSHLAASEDENEDSFTLQQFEIFQRSCEKIQSALKYGFLRHISNTAAIFRHPKLQLDMVRLGIGLYGIDSNMEMEQQLKNVSTLTTTVSQIKKLKAGDTVGYGRKALLAKETTIAVVRIGYADGYSRKFGNGIGYMLVKNIPAPVVGNVCMDMTMIDITGNDVKEGDEVVVFGEGLPVKKLAQWAETIPYEIVTGIGPRVKRIYFEEP